MSDENVETVRGSYERWEAQDAPWLPDMLDPDVRYFMPRAERVASLVRISDHI
jgi:hypothetical protein